MKFQVSVIIPVYNAEVLVEKAILSALSQSETREVLIVNDGSTDKTDIIITKIASRDSRIKVLYHKNKQNRGRAASRNLGINNASHEYIAFLDADDFYLENRFKNDHLMFETNVKCDGIYNAIGAHFYRESTDREKRVLELTTMTARIDPKNLFIELIRGRSGSFSIDGLTIKKDALTSINYFNENLPVMEDTELIWKLALKSQLISGDLLNPVAMRGVHEENIFNNTDIYKSQELKFYESLFYWSVKERLSLDITERFLERIWIVKNLEGQGILMECLYWFNIVSKSPQLLLSQLHFKYSPLQKVKRFFKSSKK